MPFPACPCSAGMIPHPSLLWPCVQQSHNFVTTEGNTMHLANCIWWHVKCIQHMPYSIFITFHRLKSHDSEGYGTQKMNFRCYGMYNPTVQCICSHFNCTAELHLAHAIFYVPDPPLAHKPWIKRIWHTENAFDMLWNVIQQCKVLAMICCHAKTIAKIKSINKLLFHSIDLKTTQYMWQSTGQHCIFFRAEPSHCEKCTQPISLHWQNQKL
jgi:hypothetical protein